MSQSISVPVQFHPDFERMFASHFLREVRPGDDVWSFLTTQGKVRLLQSMWVFALPRSTYGYVDVDRVAEVTNWIKAEKISADVYTWAHNGKIVTAAWRFLTRHRADAQKFAEQWLPALH